MVKITPHHFWGNNVNTPWGEMWLLIKQWEKIEEIKGNRLRLALRLTCWSFPSSRQLLFLQHAKAWIAVFISYTFCSSTLPLARLWIISIKCELWFKKVVVVKITPHHFWGNNVIAPWEDMWLLVKQWEKIEENKRKSSNVGIETDMLVVSEFTSTSFLQHAKAWIAAVISSTFCVNKVK